MDSTGASLHLDFQHSRIVVRACAAFQADFDFMGEVPVAAARLVGLVNEDVGEALRALWRPQERLHI